MNLTFQHANPYGGNESFVIRREPDSDHDPTACILVDAGPGVDLDSLLADDEYLTAVLLTHAHADHYLSLAQNLRDGAPIYTSKPTASILESVLDEAQRSADHDLGDTDAVQRALEPTDEWVSPLRGVRIAPVPVGHTPGAAGFVLQFDTQSGDPRTAFVTGDWTPHRVAGYPGLENGYDLGVDVDALFLAGATDGSYTETLTDSTGTIAERAVAGSAVLVSASGLTSVQYTYLLSHLFAHLGQRVPIRIVGQAATLYQDLDYDLRGVEALRSFSDPGALIGRGGITIAGPEIPTGGSAGRLFETIRNDANATLVQLVGGGGSPVTTGKCTTYDYGLCAHPTESQVDTLVDELAPQQVVVTHQRGRNFERYKEKAYSGFVWATSDRDTHTIFEDGDWSPPPWMTSEGIAFVRERNGGGQHQELLTDALDSADTDLLLPPCERTDADLSAEGLDVEALDQRLAGPRPESSHTDESTSPEREVKDLREATPANPPEADAETLTEILRRLDAIEDRLATDGTTVRARAVDAGGDVTLLRLLDTNLDTTIDHGDELEISVRGGD